MITEAPVESLPEFEPTLHVRSASPHTRRLKISGDQVNLATAALDDRARSAIRGLHGYMAEHDITPNEVGVLLKKERGGNYSGDSVYQLLTGVRKGDPDQIVDAIERFLKLESERAKIVRAPFVRTALADRIWKVCNAALIYQKVCFIIGDSQIGKTTALLAYAAEHNHGETIYVEMPASGFLGDFLIALAEALRISPNLATRELRRRIKRAFDARMLLIVDQAHEPFEDGNSHRKPLALKFIMEIHNASKCGVVLSGTNVLEEGMKNGIHRKIMRQLDLRSLAWQHLPPQPTPSNLNEFAAAYSLPPAAGSALQLQTTIIADFGLGRWCTILMAGSRLAQKRRHAMQWKDVIDGHAALAAMESTEDLQ